MGIRFSCPNGHKLNVKTFLAGKRAICPDCGAKVIVPSLSEPSLSDSPALAAIGRSEPLRFVDDAAAPSIVLAIAGNESPVEAPLETIVEALPDSIIAATTPSAVVAQQATSTAEPAYDPQRERTRRNQMFIVIALLFVVVVLAGVLIWVLKRGASPAPSTEPAAATTSSVSPSCICFPTQAKA